MTTRFRSAACALCAALVLAAGCGRPVAQSTGKVTLKGAQVPGAEVAFESPSAPEDAAYGTSGNDGTYTLSYRKDNGLPPGKYRVTVTRYTLPNGKPLPPGEEGATLRGDETKVVRHAVVFDKDLAAGANGIDLELSEGRKSKD
jgi:hypothetical protein